MRLPKRIDGFPVIPLDHPRLVVQAHAAEVRRLKHSNYSTMVRDIITARSEGLSPVDDIRQHLTETDAALRQLCQLEYGLAKVAVPRYEWCLIESSTRDNSDEHQHLLPRGYILGAEVEIIEGETVNQHQLPNHAITQEIIRQYFVSAADAQIPTLDDVRPQQFMYSSYNNQFTYVDIDAVLAAPPPMVGN